ncbi:MAG: hypothetical protein A3K11_12735 [Nitrospirae bacterium RIFCSPLOWO2_12_FULL_63_8]|nr:MAG: hypothetical protein A3K11_12735 [Nitrospirae bacterium RIFCSPLOWO2_12_FULL_63_8]
MIQEKAGNGEGHDEQGCQASDPSVESPDVAPGASLRLEVLGKRGRFSGRLGMWHRLKGNAQRSDLTYPLPLPVREGEGIQAFPQSRGRVRSLHASRNTLH